MFNESSSKMRRLWMAALRPFGGAQDRQAQDEPPIAHPTPSVRSSLALRPSPFLLLAAALAALAVSFVLGSPPAAAQDPPLSKNANLSGLTASYAYGNSTTFNALALSPAFNSGTTNYYPDLQRPPWSRHVPVYVTHVKVTPTVAHTNATVKVGKGTLTTVASGATTDAIRLELYSNNITVRVTAEDGKTTKDYTVRVSRDHSFTSILGVVAGDRSLHLSWNPPSFDRNNVLGYDVHYTSSTTVGGNAAVGSDAATGWVDAEHDGDVWAYNFSITGLNNNTAYRVRVRAVSNAGGSGDPVGDNVGGVWARGRATPQNAASDATLKALSAGSGESSDGPFNALTLSPAFSSGATAYAASVANSSTHVKLDLQMTQRNAAVAVAKSPAGATAFSHTAGWPTSSTIPLDVGANVITVRVRASDFKTYQNYTVTVTRQAGGL